MEIDLPSSSFVEQSNNAPVESVQPQLQLLHPKQEAPSIKKLSENTINKIAAGEVVISPSAALKELIENSIDAGATCINISTQGGGLSLLQIQDDGHGIHKSSFPMLCERFTTSKIEEFADLRQVSSFGFRGEALASISYCSQLTVVSRVGNSEVGYKAVFIDGMMKDTNPQTIATQFGTTLYIRDLFYNSKQRKRGMNTNDEYQKIVEVIARYAVHFPLIKFSCKNIEGKRTDVNTHSVNRPDSLVNSKDNTEDSEPDTNTVLNQLNALRNDILVRLYPSAIGKSASDRTSGWKAFDCLHIAVNVLLTKPNTVQYKKNQFLVFANNRLIESDRIKRALDQIYASYQPKGNYSYFCYMAISIRPDLIDVNVHPTKKQVVFERMDDFIELLQEYLDELFLQQGESRNFVAKNLVQKELFAQNIVEDDDFDENNGDVVLYEHKRGKNDSKQKQTNAISLVRSDGNTQTLHKFFSAPGQQNNNINNAQITQPTQPAPLESTQALVSLELQEVKKLIFEFQQDVDSKLAKSFKAHAYVGMITPDQILIQFETKIVLCQTFLLISEFVYQQSLIQLQRLNQFKFDGLQIKDLLMLALEHPDSCYDFTRHKPKDELSLIYTNRLQTIADKLAWFGILVDEKNNLYGMPNVFKGLKVYPQELPMFMLRLATIRTDVLKELVDQIAQELAYYYARYTEVLTLCEENHQVMRVQKDNDNIDDDDEKENEDDQKQEQKESISNRDQFKFDLEHHILPQMKQTMAMRKRMAVNDDMTFNMVTCTENLYKVFERC